MHGVGQGVWGGYCADLWLPHPLYMPPPPPPGGVVADDVHTQGPRLGGPAQGGGTNLRGGGVWTHEGRCGPTIRASVGRSLSRSEVVCGWLTGLSVHGGVHAPALNRPVRYKRGGYGLQTDIPPRQTLKNPTAHNYISMNTIHFLYVHTSDCASDSGPGRMEGPAPGGTALPAPHTRGSSGGSSSSRRGGRCG